MIARCVLLFALAAALPGPAAAAGRQSEQRQYRWAELGPRITGRKVAFVLPDGTRLKGKVQAVEPAGLRLKVEETSNPAAQPKGERLVPADSVRVLQVMESGKKWRIICAIAAPMVILGAIAGAAGDLPERGASGERAVAAGVFASIAGGYLLGWALDKKITEVSIIRE